MPEPEPLRPLSLSQREALEEAVSRYERAVSRDVAKYLVARGIKPEAARGARLGVVTDPAPGHSRFGGFLAIPYLAADGHPVSVRFRCLEDHVHRDYKHGKYMSLKDEPARVYNVRAIHDADDEIHVCEGELDALILNQIGLPAVGIPGATGWRGHHRRMLAGFSRIWVWGDPDDAGDDFSRTVCRSMWQAKAVSGLTGDVNQTYLDGGESALLSLIERS